ncbi:DUF192 domain-containing protein [Kiritimatiellaeota bacterium B1221]|nr:DUF192 domain-containing protein [Kiritimatiellaeota bacterium B1221]
MKAAEFSGDLKLWQGEELLLPRIRVAESFGLRSLGLMGRKRVPEAYGAGLFFENCRSLHGCFMRFELEVWFLDAEGQPMGGGKRLKPWGVVVGPKGSKHCMEILPGSLGGEVKGKWRWENMV